MQKFENQYDYLFGHKATKGPESVGRNDISKIYEVFTHIPPHIYKYRSEKVRQLLVFVEMTILCKNHT